MCLVFVFRGLWLSFSFLFFLSVLCFAAAVCVAWGYFADHIIPHPTQYTYPSPLPLPLPVSVIPEIPDSQGRHPRVLKFILTITTPSPSYQSTITTTTCCIPTFFPFSFLIPGFSFAVLISHSPLPVFPVKSARGRHVLVQKKRRKRLREFLPTSLLLLSPRRS